MYDTVPRARLARRALPAQLAADEGGARALLAARASNRNAGDGRSAAASIGWRRRRRPRARATRRRSSSRPGPDVGGAGPPAARRRRAHGAVVRSRPPPRRPRRRRRRATRGSRRRRRARSASTAARGRRLAGPGEGGLRGCASGAYEDDPLDHAPSSATPPGRRTAAADRFPSDRRPRRARLCLDDARHGTRLGCRGPRQPRSADGGVSSRGLAGAAVAAAVHCRPPSAPAPRGPARAAHRSAADSAPPPPRPGRRRRRRRRGGERTAPSMTRRAPLTSLHRAAARSSRWASPVAAALGRAASRPPAFGLWALARSARLPCFAVGRSRSLRRLSFFSCVAAPGLAAALFAAPTVPASRPLRPLIPRLAAPHCVCPEGISGQCNPCSSCWLLFTRFFAPRRPRRRN